MKMQIYTRVRADLVLKYWTKIQFFFSHFDIGKNVRGLRFIENNILVNYARYLEVVCLHFERVDIVLNTTNN